MVLAMGARQKFTRVYVAVGVVSILPVGAAGADPLPGPIPARVERVVDGDTLAVRARIWPGHEVAVLVRLDGVDAPQLRRPRCARERRRGEAARDALTPLVGAEVTLNGFAMANSRGAWWRR